MTTTRVNASDQPHCCSNIERCLEKAPPYAIAIGAILLVGGIFLILAAQQILPAGPNPISQLDIKKIWDAVAVLGGALVVEGILKKFLNYLNSPFQFDFCPNQAHRIEVLPQLTFKREDVELAIAQLKQDLSKTWIQAEGCPQISALTLLERMNGIHTANRQFLDIDECFSLCQPGLCAGLTQLQIVLRTLASPERLLRDAQTNIDRILYEHIKDQQMSLLRCEGMRIRFYFATHDQDKQLLQKQAAAGMQQIFGMTYEEAFRRQPNGDALLEEQKKQYRAFTYRIEFKIFKSICSLYFQEDSLSGRIYISEGVTQGLDLGHTLWFSYSPEGYYIQDSINQYQGLFKFSDKDSFIKALYDQMQLHADRHPQTAYFWIRKILPKNG